MTSNTIDDNEQQTHKQNIVSVFDLVAQGYDHTALRFFPFVADQIVDRTRPVPGNKVLDVATGTGVVAMAFAQAVRPGGRVMAIDLSENMLECLGVKAKHLGLDNIDQFVMDAEQPGFGRHYFDLVSCSFGLFFLPDMGKALREWRRVTRPGGKLMFTSFAKTAFQPMMDLCLSDLASFGVEPVAGKFMASRLMEADTCQSLLTDAGYREVNVDTRQMGYHLLNVEDWWAVLWNSGARSFLERLDGDQLTAFREMHLPRISELFEEDGLWLDVTVNFCSGVA